MNNQNNSESDSVIININNSDNDSYDSSESNNDSSSNNDSNNSSNNNSNNSYNNVSSDSLNINRTNSFNSICSSEENNSTYDDLTDSIDTINEDNEILNNYKYSEDYEENIEIVINEFIKLYETYPEISYKLTQTKSNIKFLPSLIKFLKDKNHKLTLNILDEPKICFEKIFNIINNNYMSEYEDSIREIQLILPNYDKHLIYEALQVNDNNIENAINYLYEN